MTLLHETREIIVQEVFNLSAKALEQAILEQTVIGHTSLDALASELAELLGIGKVEAVGLLGVSLARKTRNPNVNVDILDRAYATIEVFARVANVLGEVAARRWFQEPKKAFDGARPFELLQTRVGLNRLGQVLSALEDGAYL